jgi:putative transposase
VLRNLEIIRSNQVWALDISYIPMNHGFMYHTGDPADGHYGFIQPLMVGWQLSNSLEKKHRHSLYWQQYPNMASQKSSIAIKGYSTPAGIG